MNRFFTLVFLILFIHQAGAGAITPVLSDTSDIFVRQPDSALIENFRNDKDFDYSASPPGQTKNIFRNFFSKIFRHLQKGMNLFVVVPVFFRVLIISVILLFIYILVSRTRLKKIFYSDKKISTRFTEKENFTDVTDIDQLITTSITEKKFREAIRFLYHKVIHELDSKKLIVLSKNKTNLDYLKDLNNTMYYMDFKHVSLIYEYAWYGNFSLSEDDFKSLSKKYYDFLGKVNA